MASRHLRSLSLLLAAASGISVAADRSGPGQPAGLLSERQAAMRPQLMVVGSVHFANPARDIVNINVDDVLAPRRQAEIQAVAARLARFRPTHVAVEWPATEQAALDERYRAYRAGSYALGRSEVDQLGLRLAARLNLPRVDAVNWLGEPPGEDRDYDFRAYATSPEAKNRLAALTDPTRAARETGKLRGMTIGAYLAELNAPAHLADMNRVYFDFAMFGDEKVAPGANWVGAWYARNLRIFARLVRIADRPTDRVVVIYGAGHAFFLNQFASQSGAFTPISPEPFLGSRSTSPGARRR